MGGTSVATPVSAGIVNTAGAFRSSSSLELSYIYNAPGGFEDPSGDCGPGAAYSNDSGDDAWNFCTGSALRFRIVSNRELAGAASSLGST